MPPTENKCRMIGPGVSSLTVSNFERAEEFYCNRLGFRQIFVTRSGQGIFERCFMILERDQASLNISKPFGERYSDGRALILVSDMDALFAEFTANAVEIDFELSDQITGTRLMRVSDADGNRLEFIQLSKWEWKNQSKNNLEKHIRATMQKLLIASWKKHRRY